MSGDEAGGRLSRVLSIGQRMRRGCGVSFRQQRTNRRVATLLAMVVQIAEIREGLRDAR
jgi:hypothetical protein